MKKTLTLILAVMMLLGCMSVTAFAEETDNTTDITLTVAKSLTYDMVIPEDVTNLNAAGIYSVGQAKVANVKNATDNTVISYTAETTAFKCEGKTDIPASYYTDEAGQKTFPTTAVEVYKNKADAENIPTMYVGISETAWNAAENGTYTATVTFNFTAEEVVPVQINTIADIFSNYAPEFPQTDDDMNTSSVGWGNGIGGYTCLLTTNPDDPQFFINGISYFTSTTSLEKSENGYSFTAEYKDEWLSFKQIVEFIINGNALTSITLSDSRDDNEPVFSTFTPPQP